MRNYFIIFIFFVNCLFGEVALAAMKATEMSPDDIEEAETKMSKAVVDASDHRHLLYLHCLQVNQ